MSKVVYLSGGIMNFTSEEAKGWREQAKETLSPDTKSIDPTRISYKDRSYVEIVELDKDDIDSSTHLLVFFVRPSVGTSMEVLYAWQSGKKVYTVNETGIELSPWMLYHSTRIFPTLQDAVKVINAE